MSIGEEIEPVRLGGNEAFKRRNLFFRGFDLRHVCIVARFEGAQGPEVAFRLGHQRLRARGAMVQIKDGRQQRGDREHGGGEVPRLAFTKRQRFRDRGRQERDVGHRLNERDGETDEFGYESVVDPVHIHDWHATILHLLGLEHTKLTFRHAGRDMRLTEVKGNVVKGIIA